MLEPNAIVNPHTRSKISKSQWKSLVPVHPPAPLPPPTHDPWFVYQKHSRPPTDPQPTDAALDENYCVLQQFLHKERWLTRVQGIKHKDIMGIASHSSIYGTFHKHFNGFLLEMQASTQMFYLRRLICTRPAEEHDETHLRHHRNINPKLIDAYAKIMAAVISCLLRAITNDSLL